MSEGQDQPRLQGIVGSLLKERALPAVDRDGKPTTHKKGQLLLVPAYTSTPETWSRKLAAVCPVGAAILDPRTPARIVGLLGNQHLPSWGDDHRRFDETDVIDRLRRQDAKYFPWPSEAEWRKSIGVGTAAAAHLDALHPALASAEPAKRVAATGVFLPDTYGTLHPFEQLKRGVSLPVGLLDVDPPPSLHPAIKDHPVFRLQGWIPESFGFSDLLASGEIGSLSLAARRRFLSWLAANPAEPGRDDWPALKGLPIWASTTDELVSFDQLCRPRDSRVAGVMGRRLLRPGREVLRICKAVDSSRTRLRVRDEPSADEVDAHYRDCLATFDCGDVLPPDERSRFHAFEAELLAFGVEGRMASALRRLRPDAKALDQEGRLRPVDALVRATQDVEKLALAPGVLLDRPSVELDRTLPPLAAPSWEIVAAALRADPANTPALLARLRAISRAAGDMMRDAVEDIACIPHAGRLLAPRELAFKGNAGDYWGRWKTVISGKSLPDDVQDLYRDAGVIRSFPEPRTSRAFFEWLSSQEPTVVAEHVPQVVRHIAHGRAVTSWWLTPPEVAAIPVEVANGAALLTVSQAAKRAVVDDFPRLAEEMRAAAAAPPILLAIDAARTSTAPIADELRAIGVPGLRSVASGPHGVRFHREAAAPQQLARLLGALRSDTTAKQLRKQLKEFDVRADILEPRWQHKLAAVHGVRVGVGLRAEYRVRRRSYYLQVPWAVVTEAGEFWLEDGADLEAAFYGAVADLIFTERHRYLPLVLRAALEVRVHEFHQPQAAAADEEDEQDPDNAPSSDDDGPGESTNRHPGGEPDLSKNKPSPGPLWTGGSGKVRPRSPSATPPRPQVVDEDVQRRQLKEDHYAWHCQVALATAGPSELSPAGSYAEFQENRQKMVEAHHPDKVTAGGARNAGNLLILSHLNHDRYGRAISRQQVTDALLSTCEPRSILGADGKPWVDGVVARVAVPATGELVPIFFTHEHRAYWLQMAGHAGHS